MILLATSAGCDLFTALSGGAGLKCFDDENCPAATVCIEHHCQVRNPRADAAGNEREPTDAAQPEAAATDAMAIDRATRDACVDAGMDAGMDARALEHIVFDAADSGRSDALDEPCGNGRLEPGEACDGEPGCDPDCRGCLGGNDWHGDSVVVGNPANWSGLHCNILELRVLSGSALHVAPFDGTGGGQLKIAAQRIVVDGAIEASGMGFGGGGGGGGELYPDSHFCWCGPGCVGGSGGGLPTGQTGGSGTAISGPLDIPDCLHEPGSGVYLGRCCASSAGGNGGGAGGEPGFRGGAVVQGGGPFLVEGARAGQIVDLVNGGTQTQPLASVNAIWRYDERFAVLVGGTQIAIQDGGRFGLVTVPGLPADRQLRSVIGRDPYHLWIGTDDGLYSWDRTTPIAGAVKFRDTGGYAFDRLLWLDDLHLAIAAGTSYGVVWLDDQVAVILSAATAPVICVGHLGTASQQRRLSLFALEPGRVRWMEQSTDETWSRFSAAALPFSSTPTSCVAVGKAFDTEHWPGSLPTRYGYSLWIGTADGDIFLVDIETDATTPQATMTDSFLHGTAREISSTAIDAFADTHDALRWWTISLAGQYSLWTQAETPTTVHHSISGGAVTALYVYPNHDSRGGRGGGPWGGVGGNRGRNLLPLWCSTECVPESSLPGHPGGYLTAEANGDISTSGIIAIGSGGGGGGGGMASNGWCTGAGSGGAGGVAGQPGIRTCGSGAGGSGGGAGGGVIWLHASESIVVNAIGVIAADGAGDATLDAGYGAGGGIELMAPQITVAGAIHSLGGNSNDNGVTTNGGTIRIAAPLCDLASAVISAGRIVLVP